MAQKRFKVKRGGNVRPSSGLLAGEQLFSTIRHTMSIALDATTHVPLVPEIDLLTEIGAVADDDFMLIHDASASAVKEKKITIEALASALDLSTNTVRNDGGVSGIQVLTQAEYDALEVKAATTLYFIKE